MSRNAIDDIYGVLTERYLDLILLKDGTYILQCSNGWSIKISEKIVKEKLRIELEDFTRV